MTSPLLGPPELRDSESIFSPELRDSEPIVSPELQDSESVVSDHSTSSDSSDLSTDSDLDYHCYTENGSKTYKSTGNPCLDFFFHVVRYTSKKSLEKRLEAAWDHDALTTLKLICNLRGVRGTGKSDKEGFYTAALWLHANHPKTLACNLHALSYFGYFKDFPELLYRILQGSDIRENQSSGWFRRRRQSGKGKAKRRRKARKTETREQRIANAEKRNEEGKAKAKLEKLSLAKQAFTRYSQDEDYRFLFEKVSDLFSDYLKKDLELLNSGETLKISLAAKWCPSLDSAFDKATLLCESIAKKLFPRESFPEYEGVEEAHYAYRVRDRLRKQVLVPLRKALQLPEVYIGAKDWESLPYNRVPSVAMSKYRTMFLEHDRERFYKYLNDAVEGKTKVAAEALLPHEIIRSLGYTKDEEALVIVLQWKRMVDDLKKEGSLTNCIAISDVSGSMRGEPLEVSVALGLLVSELSEEPWKGKLITFSKNPELHTVKGEDLREKMKFVEAMQWDMNTDFQKVFDVILKVAVEGRLKPEEMIKRIFVFSDMEFDQASTSKSWETDYEMIVRKFNENGYGEAVPQILFWNLRESWSTPVMGSVKGVALVSGFSKNMLKLFLEQDGETREKEIDPVTIMEEAIAGDEYKKLAIYSVTGEIVPMKIKEDTTSGHESKKLAETEDIDSETIKEDTSSDDESKSLAKTGEIDPMTIKEDIISGDASHEKLAETVEVDTAMIKEDTVSEDASKKLVVDSEINPMMINEDTKSADESKKKVVEPRRSFFSVFPKLLLFCFIVLVASFLMQMFLDV